MQTIGNMMFQMQPCNRLPAQIAGVQNYYIWAVMSGVVNQSQDPAIVFFQNSVGAQKSARSQSHAAQHSRVAVRPTPDQFWELPATEHYQYRHEQHPYTGNGKAVHLLLDEHWETHSNGLQSTLATPSEHSGLDETATVVQALKH